MKHKTAKQHSSLLPLVEALLLGIALKALVLDDEAHSLVEGGRDGGRLFAEQDVDGRGHGVAELRALAGRRFTALRVLTDHQTV